MCISTFTLQGSGPMPIHNKVACLHCTPDQTLVSLSKMDLLPVLTHTLLYGWEQEADPSCSSCCAECVFAYVCVYRETRGRTDGQTVRV